MSSDIAKQAQDQNAHREKRMKTGGIRMRNHPTKPPPEQKSTFTLAKPTRSLDSLRSGNSQTIGGYGSQKQIKMKYQGISGAVYDRGDVCRMEEQKKRDA